MKKIIKYLLLFIIILIFLNIIPFDLDEIWNYGFAHSIYQGLIPYKDFNMVVTPFFPFFLSLFLFIFGSNSLVISIVQTILILITYFLLEKLFEKKANLLFVLLIGNFDLIYASYNYFVFFLLLIILNLEVQRKSDYLIGVLLALAVLTKQSVGLFLCLPTLYYVIKEKNFAKLRKRIIGFLFPITIFVIYLLFTNSYKQFLDLCLFGLVDFGKKNYIGNIAVIGILLFAIIITIYLIIKNPNDIKKYYVLAFSSIAFPMLDSFHIKFFFLVFLFLFIDKINLKLNWELLCFGAILGIIFLCYKKEMKDEFYYPNSINHFQYRYISKTQERQTKELVEKIEKYKDKKIINLFEQSYYYKIVMDKKIDYFDLINTGNWGYNGSQKLKKALEKEKDAIFIINKNSYRKTNQTDEVALDYVLKNGKKIDELGDFKFYIME